MRIDESYSSFPDPENAQSSGLPKEHLDEILAENPEEIRTECPTQLSTGWKWGKQNTLREVITVIALSIVLFIGLHTTLQNSEIISGSMEPTLSVNERVLINKLAYKLGSNPKRGDVIVFTPPPQVHAENDYIKRIIGLPGEKVEIKEGVVYIHKPNGDILALDEPYIAATPDSYYISPNPIPENCYFVMGDNRNGSHDSRAWGTVKLESIVGKALFTFRPLSKIGTSPNHKLP